MKTVNNFEKNKQPQEGLFIVNLWESRLLRLIARIGIGIAGFRVYGREIFFDRFKVVGVGSEGVVDLLGKAEILSNVANQFVILNEIAVVQIGKNGELGILSYPSCIGVAVGKHS